MKLFFSSKMMAIKEQQKLFNFDDHFPARHSRYTPRRVFERQGRIFLIKPEPMTEATRRRLKTIYIPVFYLHFCNLQQDSEIAPN
jgi:hypothetical protein